MGRALGVAHDAIHDGLMNISVKGRVELVPVSKDFTVLIDFAHNEAGAESLLTTLRAYEPKRLVVLFGCGGDRSHLRRYGMGEVASRKADFLILTEDNNRFESVDQITRTSRCGDRPGQPGRALCGDSGSAGRAALRAGPRPEGRPDRGDRQGTRPTGTGWAKRLPSWSGS